MNDDSRWAGFNTDLDLNWNDYGARWYDPSIGRFPSIDRFAENYYNMTTYQYGGNSPILNIDMNGDSIRTYFYDRNGNLTNTIPAAVQRMFNEEYGITVGYQNGMLFQTGTATPIGPVANAGVNLVVQALGTGIATTELAFGYDLAYHYKAAANVKRKELRAVSWGEHVGDEGAGLALIDLAEFNTDGSLKFTSTNRAFNPRSMNMGRVFEHEFFGHGIAGFEGNGSQFNHEMRTSAVMEQRGFGSGGNVGYLNRTFYESGANIPRRATYSAKTDIFSNTGTITYGNSSQITQKRTIIRARSYR